MTELQSALIIAAVGLVLLVYLYNWWQAVRRRREIERAVAAHKGRSREPALDPLGPADGAPLVAAQLRVEPAMPEAGHESGAESGASAARVEPGERSVPPRDTVGAGEPLLHGAGAVRGALLESERGSGPPARAEPFAAQAAPKPSQGPDAGPARALERVSVPVQSPSPRPRMPRAMPPGLALRPDPADTDPRVDYLVRLLPLEPVLAEDLAGMLGSAPDLGRRFCVLGCPVGSQDWQPVLRQSERYEELAFALQQVDRSGLIERAALDRFAAWVDDIAERTGAGSTPPDPAQAHAKASAFDAFCAEADVLIGVNVVAPDVPVPGTKVRALVEAAGFRLQTQGHYTLEDEQGVVMLTLSDIEGEPLVADRIRARPVTGVTLLLDIPRTPHPARVFGQMMQIARQVAQGIGGRVVDDQRQTLSDAGVRLIAERIVALDNRLAAHNMAPGSALARRVFA